LRPLGNLLLRAHLVAAMAAADAGHGGRAPRRDRRLPGDVDVRADHAGRLPVVLAQRGRPAVRGVPGVRPVRGETGRGIVTGHSPGNGLLMRPRGGAGAGLDGRRRWTLIAEGSPME